ncbi:hypothetical protein [Streptomyces sp. NRRL F-5135]|uniref:hypothetical protein n=1 Tax=Streptomyces sp. NRRL F-5135 TaxID=1463858 RepID=UPI0004C65217|nr:hypothetical protein [Streptomyces sp. NRRL F-5135]
MDAVTLGAVGTIIVGLAAAAAAVYGHRGQQRVNHSGAVMTGYGGLVDQLQEERAELRARIAEKDRDLAAAYAELAAERAEKTALQGQINDLNAEIRELRARLTALGGDPQ